MKRNFNFASIWTLLVSVFFCAAPAQAGEFTDVIDAFDKDNKDPFDLNLSVGYERYQEKGTITRESMDNDYLHQWDYYAKTKFAKFDMTRNILNLGLDVGLFHDLSVRLGVPIILSDDRSFNALRGWAGQTPLFSSTFKSPQRSGVDYIAAGLWWNILDQGRTKEHPYLTVFLEGRFGVGAKLKAACANDNGSNATDCASAAYTSDGGISQNLNQLRMGLHFSRRYGRLEPYMGIDGMLGWYKGKDFTMGTGALNDLPPAVGTFDFGMEIIPWDVPEEFRKFVIVIGGGATYVSEGRTYTPLFDALGTSEYFKTNADINDSGTTAGASEPAAVVTAEREALAAWNGMTDVENYGEFFGRLVLSIQPAKYVKFNVGLKMGHQSEHFITKTDQCPAGSVGADGTCATYNPGHRPEIDEPGRRFRVEDTFVWSLFLDAIAQF